MTGSLAFSLLISIVLFASLAHAFISKPHPAFTPCDAVTKRGGPFSCSEHTVLTEDGFLLRAYRISSSNVNSTEPLVPVLLQHGLVDFAIDI